MTFLDNLVQTSWAQALGFALAHSIWEGAAAALLLLLAMQLLPPPAARIRYAAACIILFSLPAAFALTFGVLFAGAPPPVSPLPRPAWIRLLSAIPADAGTLAAPRSWAALLPWLTPVWMIGAALWYLRAFAGWATAQRLRRVAVCRAEAGWQLRLRALQHDLRISRTVVLLESALAEVPVVIGFFRPVILMPLGLLTGFPPKQVEAFLIHELAHIRRCDYLVNLMQGFVEGLFFYHPGVWWISAQVRAERENCCDDAVVALTGDPRGYAAALTTFEESRWQAAGPVLAATGGPLRKRVHRLLGRRQPRLAAGPVIGLLFLSACLALAARSTKSPAVQTNPPALSSPSAPLDRAPQPARLLAQANTPSEAKPETPYEKWLHEDVAYIITDAERQAFRRLQTDAERDYFIVQFWLRRDPTPGTPLNEFKVEHYRRLVYANEHFRAPTGIAGWKTDRGRIYIVFGPPDEIDGHPNGGPLRLDRFHPERLSYPFEDWRYRYIQGIGNDVLIEFADKARNGEYHMTMDPAENGKRVENPAGRGGGATQRFQQLNSPPPPPQ